MREDGTLVLGASGFLGPHVVAAAVERARALATFADPYGDPVLGVCRQPELAPLFSEPREAADWLAVDLQDSGASEALLDDVRPARVLLCAALSRVGDCEERPKAAQRLNAGVPRDVAAWCAAHGTRLVHVSTDLVFGGEDAPEGGFREDATPSPLSVYGSSKAEGETAVLEAFPEAMVVRLPLLYGNSGARGLGASDSLLEAVERDGTPGLFVDEWRTPLEVRNAAEALVELAFREESGRLHVAGPDRVSRHELGSFVLSAMGLDTESAQELVRAVKREDVPTRGARPRDVALDASRACALLETPLLGVREGMERAMR